ncbi:hypothetical protein AVEN_92984-1 [Araneus ventricosus]|uniref:Uncharacterized protein n=1 Tax=Araneus ventricosus TaxID=182803 RepID=A0A4Y2JNA2_ARAVE|nr:hypothetical protein AVEN_92984-1 [Araneus ventricosus]
MTVTATLIGNRGWSPSSHHQPRSNPSSGGKFRHRSGVQRFPWSRSTCGPWMAHWWALERMSRVKIRTKESESTIKRRLAT